MSSTKPITPAADRTTPMSHREVIEALSGLMLGMLVAILSSTVVSTSLPRIIGDLGGSESEYTWVVTASLLATTVSTPIWGKFADLFNRKLLVQLSLVVFVLGSALSGLSQDSGQLIGFRVLQGLGAGGLTALSTVVLADIISPRERGKYMGLLGAVMAVGTIGGPLLGGVITDSIGWRWDFYVGVPIAAAAIILLQKTLHLPTRRREGVKIDYLGTALVAGSVSLLLIWVTMAGNQFAWGSATSIGMVVGAVLLGVAFVLVEFKVAEPILPMSLFRNKTFTLAVVASISVGVAMFGTSVFLSQYMQLARGKTPTMSGVLTIPMILGVLLASTIAGQLITRTGKWKRYVVSGAVILVVGLTLMGTIRYDTSWTLLSIYMFLVGTGVGMAMQNLVLVVQNTLPLHEMGVGTAAVAFFRSLGGAIGVSVMGAFLATRLTSLIAHGLAGLGVTGGLPSGGDIPNLAELPAPVRTVVESSYGTAIGNIFLLAVPLAIVTLLAVIFLPNRALGERSNVQRLTDSEPTTQAAVGTAPASATTVADEGAPVAVAAHVADAGSESGPGLRGRPSALVAGLEPTEA